MPGLIASKRTVATNRPPNIAKGKSYAEAWRRIKRANENGYFFESVTICESIITDRLLSFAKAAYPTRKLNERTAFSALIKTCMDAVNSVEVLNSTENRELLKHVDQWRDQRNVVVHGIAKSMPGTPTTELDVFIKNAEKTAKTGAAIAREVLRFHAANFGAIKNKQGENK